eukprot:4914956-Pleurochrysis_carterae.AAC.1
MADVSATRSWAERNFAEWLGIWEVNVFKALAYFYPRWKLLPHADFHARLAWALMTLNKAPYPADVRAPTSTPDASAALSQGESGGGSGGTSGRSAIGIAPLPGGHH